MWNFHRSCNLVIISWWFRPILNIYARQNGFIFPNDRGEQTKIFESTIPSLWNLSFKKHIPLASHLGRKCGDGMFKDLDIVCRTTFLPRNPATSGGYQAAFVPPAPVLPCPTSIAPRPHPPWPREAPWGNSPFSSTKSCPVRCKRYCGHQGQRVTQHLEEGAKTDTKNHVSWELYLGIFWGIYMLNFRGPVYPWSILDNGNLRIQVPPEN